MPICVLIVDDSPVMRGFIRRTMGLAGIEVAEYLEAANGLEALSHLRQRAVDLVLTDINMPGMNGEELIGRMQSEGLLRTTPTVVISTDSTGSRIHQMIEMGARGYVTKPFSPESLREKLEGVLEGCRP